MVHQIPNPEKIFSGFCFISGSPCFSRGFAFFDPAVLSVFCVFQGGSHLSVNLRTIENNFCWKPRALDFQGFSHFLASFFLLIFVLKISAKSPEPMPYKASSRGSHFENNALSVIMIPHNLAAFRALSINLILSSSVFLS